MTTVANSKSPSSTLAPRSVVGAVEGVLWLTDWLAGSLACLHPCLPSRLHRHKCLPACLPACPLRACLPASLHACLPACLPCLLAECPYPAAVLYGNGVGQLTRWLASHFFLLLGWGRCGSNSCGLCSVRRQGWLRRHHERGLQHGRSSRRSS